MVNFLETSYQYNKLLKRHELHAIVEYEQNPPTRSEMRQAIASKFNIPENRVVILKMTCMFGTRKMRVHSHVYDNEEDIFKLEKKYILKRNGLVS